YTPSQFDSGMYSVQIVATDHRAFGDIYHSFQLHVKNQNQTPWLVQDFPDTVYIMENQPYSRTFYAVDPDADSIHFSLINVPSGMVIDPNTGMLDWTPDYSQSGLYTVTVNVMDTIGASSKDSLVFAVFNMNRSPFFTSVIPDTVILQEGKNFLLDIDASDDDAEPLRYSISFTPSGMTFDTATGVLSWNPAYWQAGDYGFVFQVFDTSGANEFRSVLFTVIDSNQIPLFSMVPNDTLISEGQTYNAMIIATDPDSDPMKYFVQSGLPAGFSLDSSSGFMSWTPDSTQHGVYPITIEATDQRPLGSITHSFTITVDNVNLVPVITTPFPDTLYFVEGQNYNFSYSAFDGDGDPISYYVYDPPAGMTVDSLTGDIVWTPSYVQAGIYNPVFKAKDPSGSYGSKSVVILVLNMNRFPVFTATMNDTVITENQLLQFPYAALDADLDSLSFTLMMPVPGMTMTAGGLLEWTPNYAQAGIETVIVMLTDYGSIVLDTAVITVNNVNNPPMFIAPLKDTAIARFDTLRIQYQGFDPDAQPISFSIVNGPGEAIMSPSGYFEWAPPANSNGMYTFVVQISDSTLTTNDSLHVRVNRLGDVSGNGSISSFDAGLILREQVGAITLQPLQVRVGDVSGDTTLSSSDASFILQYVVGLISNFPGGLEKRSQSEAVMSAFAFRIVPTQTENEYELIVSVNKPSNVYGITMSLAYDSTVIAPKSMLSTALTDSMMVASFFPKERANLALAGTHPLNTAGDIARFTFTLRRKDLSGNAVLFTMKKFVLNEKDYANDIAGITLSVKPTAALPTVYALEQNYPNPFNPSTTIKYQLPNTGRVSIIVYNMLGQMVKQLVDADLEAGYHTIVWNGTDRNGAMVSSGVYLYKITALSNGKNVFTSTKKMLFLK
ncbi:MAG: putative Ig domain-containing protein, partial [Bacteroidetes bacterium]|nr:putative Ig domain-containing protein [Bacteroidota bacterium]